MTSVQYRVVLGKRDEIVHGADDADLVVSIPVELLSVEPAVSFMQGKLKSVGSTGALFQIMASGELATAFAELDQR